MSLLIRFTLAFIAALIFAVIFNSRVFDLLKIFGIESSKKQRRAVLWVIFSILANLILFSYMIHLLLFRQ